MSMGEMGGFETVIFDMDGTLLNTVADLAGSVNHVLKTLGYPAVSLEKVQNSVGNGAGVLIGKVLPGGKDNPDYERAVSMHTVYYEEHCNLLTKPYDGVTSVLCSLKEAGVKMAIVSNKGDGAVKELSRLYFSDYITVSVGEREGIRRKPFPDTVEEAVRQIGGRREGAVYVGDSEVDLETAIRADMPCILASWGFRGRKALEELVQNTAGERVKRRTCIIDKPEELVRYMKQ